MKQTLITIIFIISILIVSNLKGIAQEDMTLTKNQGIQGNKLTDSLSIDNKANKLQPLLPTNTNQEVLSPLENISSIHIESPHKKNTIFNSSYSKFIIPVTFITLGAVTKEINTLKKIDTSTHREVQEHFEKTMPIDNFLQFVPITAVYGLDLAGIAKAKHNFRDRIIISTTSYLIMGITVETMKNTIPVKRPDADVRTSFPSGHTATAFVGAHILFKEYKDVSPWIGIAGYTSATATGVFRVLNKRHWVSDVVCGAGVGILSAEVGYMLLPVFQNILGIRESNKNLVITPIAVIDNYGIGMAYTF